MKFIIALLLIMLTLPANGQYLNQVNNPLTEGTYGYQSLLSSTHLYYETEIIENDNLLWSMNLATKQKQQLITSANTDIAWPMVELNGMVYFKVENKSSNSSRGFLMRTDGSAENTLQVNETTVSDRIRISGNQLFMTDPQSKLLQLRNDEFTSYDIEVPANYAICVFDENHFVVQTQNDEQNNFSLTRYNLGEATELYNYSAPALYGTFSSQHADNCYFTITNSGLGQPELEPIIITAPKLGDAQVFETIDGIPTVHNLFTHQGRLYVTAGDALNSDSVYRLTQDLLGFDASYTLEAGIEFATGVSTN